MNLQGEIWHRVQVPREGDQPAAGRQIRANPKAWRPPQCGAGSRDNEFPPASSYNPAVRRLRVPEDDVRGAGTVSRVANRFYE